jgi:hypothetical protein
MSLRKVLGFILFKSPSQGTPPVLPQRQAATLPPSGSSTPTYPISPISLPAWEGRCRDTDNDEEWVIIPTTEQENWKILKAQYKALLQQFKEAGGETHRLAHLTENPADIKAAIQIITQEIAALQAWLLQSQALDTLITLRTSLVRKIKMDKHYYPGFDTFLSLLERLSDKSLDYNQALEYTQQVTTILQLLLIDKPRYCLFMQLAQDNLLYSTPDDHSIHSQAIQLFIFLMIHTYVSLYELPDLPMQHRPLIKMGKQLTLGLHLLRYLNSDPAMLALKKGMSWGQQCQFNVSVFCKAQSFFDLPFTISPIDPLLTLPEGIIEEALTSIHSPIELLGHWLYPMAFWQHYLITGYKQDSTLEKASLLRATCDRAEQTHQHKVAISKLHKKHQKKMSIDKEEEEDISSLFVLAIKEAIKKHKIPVSVKA